MKKYNIKFVENKKIYFGISLGIMLIGIIFNIIWRTKLDIQFTGGAIAKYSYSGTIDENQIKDVIQKATDEIVTVQISKDMTSSDEEKNIISVEFSGNKEITLEQQKDLTTSLSDNFPGNGFNQLEVSSVDPSMGRTFFLKCMAAIGIASVLMVFYVTFRFRKISGFSAGVMALLALIHDIIMVYFTFIIFRMPLDDNFIAVVLMILGYSLNDTIVIYDRIRENKGIMDENTPLRNLVNKSINQTFSRTLNTSISTIIAIATVLIVALIFNLSSVVSFALPMVIGIISGCYSSICIASPLWVMWKEYKNKK